MAGTDAVQRAYDRCSVLRAIVQRVRADALARPSERRWVELGIVDPADKQDAARESLERLFDELQALIEHVFVLDMGSQFERSANQRVDNYVGHVRKAARKASAGSGLPRLSADIVRGADDYRGMQSYLALLERHIDGELYEKLQEVRVARNNFAHGTDIMALPGISREEARDSLCEALKSM